MLLDHLVVFTDDPDRTILAYAELGLEVQARPRLGNGTTQTFFRAGEVVIELVGPIGADGDGERFWGLSPTVADLDACARCSASSSGRSRTRPNPGAGSRRCGTKPCGLTIPIAFMSPEPDRTSR